MSDPLRHSKGYTGDLGCSWTWKLRRRIQPARWQTARGWRPVPPPSWNRFTDTEGCVFYFIALFWNSRTCSYFLSSFSYCSCVKSKGKQAFTLFSWKTKRTHKLLGNKNRLLLWFKLGTTVWDFWQSDSLTYPWPEDGDNDDKMSDDGEKPCRDETANSRHANTAASFSVYTPVQHGTSKAQIILIPLFPAVESRCFTTSRARLMYSSS